MWNFFEQPWTLLGAAAIVLLGVLTFRGVWPEKRAWWQWLLPAGIAVLGVGLDLGVTTDMERINRIAKIAMGAAEKEDCVALGRLLAEDYSDSFHKDKQALLSQCRARLVPPAVERVRKIGMAVKITPPEATVTLTARVKLEPGSFWVRSYGKSAALVKAQFWLRKQPDKSWLITRIEVLEVDTMPTSWGVAKDGSRNVNQLACS
jgi:hypothetical protein